MSELTITTNRHWRDFKYRDEVPAAILAGQFDWTAEGHAEHGDYSDGFLCYRGVWYHLADFMINGEASGRDAEGHPVWDGHHGDSYFSGVFIKLSDDGERYKIGTYTN